MDRSTQIKMVVCGVALVSLSTVRAASAQTPCPSNSGGGFDGTGGSGAGCFIQFTPGPQTKRVDYFGHSFKVIVNVTTTFYLNIRAVTTSDFTECPGTTDNLTSLTSNCRYPDDTETCIRYDVANCVRYDVTAFASTPPSNPIPPNQEGNYFSGKIHYRIAWNFPDLTVDDNPRGLRAASPAPAPFNDLTDGVFPSLLSGQDPGVDTASDGFSQYIVVQEPHDNDFAGCLTPVNCSDTTGATNVFNAGQTIPIKVVLSPRNPAADLRLTYTDPGGTPHLAQASGDSNIGNMFRATGSRFEFNWSTVGLLPGTYTLTISPGTSSGGLFAPQTFKVTLR